MSKAPLDFLKSRFRQKKSTPVKASQVQVGNYLFCMAHTGVSVSPSVFAALFSVRSPEGCGRIISSSDKNPITEARKEMVENSKDLPDIKYIVFIENDVIINPGLLIEHQALDADVVSFPVFDAAPPHLPNIYKNSKDRFFDFLDVANQNDRETRVVDIYASDPGCVCIKSELLYDDPCFEYKNGRTDIFNLTNKLANAGRSVMASTKLTLHREVRKAIGVEDFRIAMEHEKIKADKDYAKKFFSKKINQLD